MSTINSPQSRTINNIQFRVYKNNIIDGWLWYLETVEMLHKPITVINNISLIPTGGTNMWFVLKFDTEEKRDSYRDYVFSMWEWKQFGQIKFPEILADYQIDNASYLLIAVRPYLDINSPSDDAVFRGLPMDIEKVAQSGIVVHSTVANL